MPQIDAPTVAEHRAQQREALLDAAEAILLEAGHGALTFRHPGRTHRARPQLDLPLLLVARRPDRGALRGDMPRWLQELETAMAAADGAGRAGGGVRLHATAARRRTAAIGWPSCSGTCRSVPRSGRESTRSPTAPRRCPSPSLAPEDPQLVAQLVQGVVNAGVRLLHGAGTLEQVEPLTVTLAQTLVPSRAR